MIKLTSAAVAGYLAARVITVKKGLSKPRKPFVWRPDPGATVLLKGADLIDVRTGQLMRKCGLTFSGQRITKIVPANELDQVKADRIFDATGFTIIPGLINSHGHVLLPGCARGGLGLILSLKRQVYRNLEECGVRGVTTVRDAGSFSRILASLNQRIETLELLGPRVFTSGPIITAKGGHPEFARPLPRLFEKKFGNPGMHVHDPTSARDAVRYAVEQGAKFIKIGFDEHAVFIGRKSLNTMDDESIKALIDEAHKLGRRVAAHITEISGFRRALKLGVDDLEHVPIDKLLTDEDISTFMKGDHHITPTASCILTLAMAPDGHPARSSPMIDSIQREREKTLMDSLAGVAEEEVVRANKKLVRIYMEEDPTKKLGKRFLFDTQMVIDGAEILKTNTRKLYEAGAKMCCGNDSGMPLSFPGALCSEMVALERIGMSNADILKAATINAADMLGLDQEIGTLDKGKLADFVVLSSNPMEDVRAIERVEAVFRDGILLHCGQRFPLSERQHLAG